MPLGHYTDVAPAKIEINNKYVGAASAANRKHTYEDQMKLKAGIIGCGGIAQMMHIPHLFELKDMFEIYAVTDINREVASEIGRLYHVEKVFSDYCEMLREPVDCVFILSGDSHFKPVMESINAGKHIFCEKPLGENVREVREISEALKKVNLTLMVAYHKRYDPVFPFIKSKILEMKDLRFVQVNVLHPVDARYRDHYSVFPQNSPEKIKAQNEEETDGLIEYITCGTPAGRIRKIIGENAPLEQQVGAFLLFNSLIHDVNLLRGILGEPHDVLNTYFWKDGRCMTVHLKYAVDLHCVMNWIYLAGVKSYREELIFLSPEKRVSISFPSPYLKNFPTHVAIEEMENDMFVEKKITVSYEEAFKREIIHFYECVCNGKSPFTDINDALNDTIILEKIARAYRK
jgi:predicted dehydrogenase